MRKRGEITVFLSLTIVCILSLCLGLLESARTTGARLYAQMAADSAAASVMSQYNRNLWDMYHLLFLEAESEDAIRQSFSEYLEFYMEQENLYPMRLENVEILKTVGMMEEGGVWLENSALSYVKYRVPEIAGDLVSIAEDAANASKAGDFRELFEVCRQTGNKTRKLEACRRRADGSLEEMRELIEELRSAVSSESGGSFERLAHKFGREIQNFSELVDEYEGELDKVSNHREKLEQELRMKQQENEYFEEDTEAMVSEHLNQEMLAYEQVETAAREQSEVYRRMEAILERNQCLLDEAVGLLEEERYEYVDVVTTEDDGESEMELVPVGPDWDAIGEIVSQMEVPDPAANESIDREKASLLDQLEELFQGDLLKLVLPEGADVSRRSVSLREVPSKYRSTVIEEGAEKGELLSKGISNKECSDKNMSESSLSPVKLLSETAVKQLLVNEYCFLSFDSFLDPCSRKIELQNQPLLYEQEYLLCGEPSDRENLAETVERLLTVRGSMNLLYLLRSPQMRAEADALSMAVSGGNAPVKFIVSFFILTMWAFGEAVIDVKRIMNGGSVSFWKDENQWELSLEELLAFRFLDPVSASIESESLEEGSDYKDHMRILFFLLSREERNFRMMDVIQWNLRTIQKDFAVDDCVCRVEMEAKTREQHLFLMKNSYMRTLKTVGMYE